MDKKYYLKNLPWAAFFLAAVIYQWWGSPENTKLTALLVLSLFSFLVYPFSKKMIEIIALKITKEEFWYSGIFRETVGKNGLYVIYYAFCFVFAIPFGLFFFFYYYIKKAA